MPAIPDLASYSRSDLGCLWNRFRGHDPVKDLSQAQCRIMLRVLMMTAQMVPALALLPVWVAAAAVLQSRNRGVSIEPGSELPSIGQRISKPLCVK